MNNRALVLYYHRVEDLKDDINLLCVTPTIFEQQMRYLKYQYNILRFEEDWSNSDRDSIVITFDDGYLDNLQNALPILEELEIPATIFVSTGTLADGGELWWDELENIMLSDYDCPKSIRIQDERYDCKWNTDTYELRKNCYRAIHFLMKNCIDVRTRNNWMQQLREQNGVGKQPRKTHKTLDMESCIQLSNSKYITIGAHTVSHPSLARLDVAEQKKEVLDSKSELENILDKNIDIFSYPFGKENIDFDEYTIQICKSAGIRKAASTVPGVWKKGCDEYAIPRNIVRNWGIFEFKEKITGYWNR